MRVRWKDFELPTRLVCDEKTLTRFYGLFVAEPFERDPMTAPDARRVGRARPDPGVDGSA